MTNKEQTRHEKPEDKVAAPGVQQNNAAKDKPEQEKSAMIKTEIKKAWNKLSEDDVNLYESQPDLFFARIKDKHGANREQAEARLQSIKNTCRNACSSEKVA